MHNLAFIAAITTYILTCYFVVRWSFKREGIISTGFVTAVAMTIYYVAIPVEFYLLDSYFYNLKGYSIELTALDNAYIVLNSAFALMAFMAGYNFSGFSILPESQLTTVTKAKPHWFEIYRTTITSLCIASLAIIILFYPSQIAAKLVDYHSNVETAYENPAMGFLLELAITNISVLAIAFWYIYQKRLMALSMPFAGILFGIFTSDKNPILISLLPLACFLSSWLLKQRMSFHKIYLWGMLAVSFLLILLPVFSLYRANVNIFNLDILQTAMYFSFTRIDPGGPFFSLATTYKENSELLYGSEYIKNLAILIPKSLYSDRPLDLSERFARAKIQNWSPGKGLGFSLMAEGLMNFGPYFCFLHYIIMGFLWGKGWSFIQSVLLRKRPVSFIYRVLGIYLLILTHRGTSLALLKPTLHFCLPFYIVFLLLRYLYKQKGFTNVIFYSQKGPLAS